MFFSYISERIVVTHLLTLQTIILGTLEKMFSINDREIVIAIEIAMMTGFFQINDEKRFL